MIRYGKETILLVEDEAKNCRVMASILESYGYTVLQAAYGQESFNLSRLQVEEIDLVLLDLNMSRITGQEALSALRAVELAIFTELSLGKKHFLGVAGIISKPIDLKRLVRDGQEALGV